MSRFLFIGSYGVSTVFLRCFYGGFSIFINSARGFCGESLIFIGCIVWNDDDAVGNEWTPQLSYLLRILPTVASRYLCIEFEFVSKHLTAAVEIAIGTLRFHGKGRVISILDFMSSFWFQLDALERFFLTSNLVPGFQGALGPTAAFAFWPRLPLDVEGTCSRRVSWFTSRRQRCDGLPEHWEVSCLTSRLHPSLSMEILSWIFCKGCGSCTILYFWTRRMGRQYVQRVTGFCPCFRLARNERGHFSVFAWLTVEVSVLTRTVCLNVLVLTGSILIWIHSWDLLRSEVDTPSRFLNSGLCNF